MEDYIEYAKAIPEFKPLVKQVLESVADYKEEFEAIQDFVVANIVKIKSDVFKGFVAAGLTREEALALTINVSSGLKESMRNVVTVKKSK